MISLARSIPGRDSRRARAIIDQKPCIHERLQFTRHTRPRRPRRNGFSTPVNRGRRVSRRPMNSASSSRSSSVEHPPLDDRAVLPKPQPRCTPRSSDRFFQRTPRRVECAPQPNPSHSPSVQYFRLWRDSRPGRATFEISYCTIAGARPVAVDGRTDTSPPRRHRARATTGHAPSRRAAARWDRSRAGRARRARGRAR